MKAKIKEYIDHKLVIFTFDLKQKQHKNGVWKKDCSAFPPDWSKFTLDNTHIDEKQLGVALLTGKVNNIIVVDIDNVDHWNKFLKDNNKKEPKTVKAISGSGGLHYYFKYTDDLSTITSKDHCVAKEYDIDVKTNGGCIIVAPTKYFNKNLDKNVECVGK